MRLWHKDLIPFLPRQQLLGQWRECCAIAKSIAEKGAPNHVLVNKVMEYPIDHFIEYSTNVAVEMKMRGYKVNPKRFSKPFLDSGLEKVIYKPIFDLFPGWHNNRYLHQCLANLQEKADCGAIPADEWKKITDRWPEWK